MAKLKDLGYNDNECVLLHLDRVRSKAHQQMRARITSIRFHNLVNQPRDLTDRIWNSIKPQLVQ